MKERIQKVLSRAGVCSRREAEKFILQGKVKVNNSVAVLGDKIEIGLDKIILNNNIIKTQNLTSHPVYYLVNKPKGYICTTKDRYAKKMITDLVPELHKIWPVGRLDKDSTGLIILTNDGDLTNKLTHPKFEHEKEYEVVVNKKITKDFLDKMEKGVKLKQGIAKVDKIKKIDDNKFNVVLHQGWNRQIRRMCGELGYGVVELKRIRIGNIKLGRLKEGEFKKISRL